MKKTLLFFVGVLVGISAYSQSVLHVFEDWSSTAGSQNFFHKNVTKTDGSSNVYVAGATLNGSGNYDILLAKYNSSGVQQWIVQYNGAGNNHDAAIGLYIDGSSNVYITGVITTSTNIDMVTIKYNSSGTQQWLSTYNGTGSTYDCGSDLVVDASGNVYVTGASYNASGNTDYVTIKYNSSGTQQWATLYDYTTNLNDAPVKIAHKASTGVVTVSGAVQSSSTVYKVGVISYNDNTGAQTGATISSGGSSGVDQVFDMTTDASGNIYIAGGIPIAGQGYNTYVVKLNASLIIQWESTYNGSDSLDDMAHGVKVDASGNVFITGYTTTNSEGKNTLTLKYNSSGTQQWVETYNDTLNGDDVGNALVLDGSSNVYVAGYDSTAMNGTDYYTIKYNSSGTEVWSIRDDGEAHKTDKATNIAKDASGDIVITGVSQKLDGSLEYKTIKYVEKNIIVPTDFVGEDRKSNFLFFENKGQVIKTDSTLVPSIRYYTNNTSPLYYFMGDTLSMVFISTDSVKLDTLHRISVSFTNSNSNKKIYPLSERTEFLNYYLGFCPEGITHVFGNEQLVVPSLYPNIDLIYSSNQNGFKFYFIIKPGGVANDIKMQYTGVTSTSLNTGTQDLTINSVVGGITFDQPLFYQINSSNVIISASDGYADWHNYTGNKYGFDSVTVLDSTKALIIVVDEGNASVGATSAIDNLEWSTYVGGDAQDGATDICTDRNGHPYITGTTWSTNFPVATTYQVYSASQPNKLGSQDSFTMKFNKTTRRVEWATYLGGSGVGTAIGATPALDRTNDIKAYKGTDPTKNYVFVTGTTWSIDFPVNNYDLFATGHSQNNSLNLIRMIVAAYRQSDGVIKWSTCHGGTSAASISEEGTSLDVYEDGTLVIGGAMTGIAGAASIPAIPLITPSGAYTKNDASGFFVLFDSNYDVNWFTLFGSIGGYVNDVKIILEQGGSGWEKKAYLTGKAATSTPFQLDVVPNPGNEYYQSTCAGNYDAYIARLNIETTYDLEYSTYWGGNDEDVGVAIQGTDKVSLYFAGYTKSTNLTTTELPNPGGVAYYDGAISGSSDAFILAFNPVNQNSLDWGTLYGGNQNDVILDMCIDIDERLYITGETKSTSGFIQATAGSFYDQSVLGNDVSSTKTDAFLLAFNSGHNDIHSTYFGGLQPDGGAGITTDGIDNLYLTGTAVSTEVTFPVVEFDLGSPLDWWDGAFVNNVASLGYMPSTYARPSGYTYEGVYEGGGLQAADAFIAGFKIQTSLSIGINESEALNPEVALFPNPTSGNLTLITTNEELKDSDIEIVNMLGQTVKNTIKFNNLSISIDVSELNAGMYFVAIKGKKSYISIKFIKQ